MNHILVTPRHNRTSKLGQLGEQIAEEALKSKGFEHVCNLNQTNPNQPYADLQATRNGELYFIGVKTRNVHKANGTLNESYNCFLVSGKKNRRLKTEGKSVHDITKIALEQIKQMAFDFNPNAIPAWVVVAIRPQDRTHSMYFGTLEKLGCKRSIPMTPNALKNYECLAEWVHHESITPDLTNILPM